MESSGKALQMIQFQELMVIIYASIFYPSRCFNVATGFEPTKQLGMGMSLGGNFKNYT